MAAETGSLPGPAWLYRYRIYPSLVRRALKRRDPLLRSAFNQDV